MVDFFSKKAKRACSFIGSSEYLIYSSLRNLLAIFWGFRFEKIHGLLKKSYLRAEVYAELNNSSSDLLESVKGFLIKCRGFLISSSGLTGLLIVWVVNLGSTKLFPKLFPPKFPPIFPGDTACNGSKSCGLASGSGAEDTEAVKQAMAWNFKVIKVCVFWEGHYIWRNLHFTFDQ